MNGFRANSLAKKTKISVSGAPARTYTPANRPENRALATSWRNRGQKSGREREVKEKTGTKEGVVLSVLVGTRDRYYGFTIIAGATDGLERDGFLAMRCLEKNDLVEEAVIDFTIAFGRTDGDIQHPEQVMTAAAFGLAKGAGAVRRYDVLVPDR